MNGKSFLQRKKMIDMFFTVVVFVLPFCMLLYINYSFNKDIALLYKSVSNLEDKIKTLSTYAASIEDRVDTWNPYKKKVKND
jgi:hypothetical protein